MNDQQHALQPEYQLQAIRALEERIGAAETALRKAEADLLDMDRELADGAAGPQLRLGPGLVLHGNGAQRAAYFAALAKAQGEYGPIARTRTVTVRPREGQPYTFDYAPLEEVVSATRPALTANGIAYSSYIADGEHSPELHTLLTHVDGGFMHMVEKLPNVEKPQQMGSALTYHRRYQYQCLTGTSPEYDDDGNEASGNQVQNMTQRNRQPPAPAQRPPAAPTVHKAAPKPAAPAPAQAQRPASAPPPAPEPPKPVPAPAAAEEPPPPRDEDAHMPVDVVDVGHQDMTTGASDRAALEAGNDPASQDQVDAIVKEAKRLRWDRVALNKYIGDRIDPAKNHTTLTFADAAALIAMLSKQAPNA